MEENKEIAQKAILVGLFQGLKDDYDERESMNELAELAKAAGAEVLETFVQNKSTIEAPTYIGSGKVEEIKMAVIALEANLVIFNDELSGAQIRNLEDAFDVPVIDRTALILDIFALRAQSKIAKLQVELAQLKYRMPRLTGQGKSLSRTGGGIGTRGPGEQKLEIDRRRIKSRIDDIRKQIKEAEKHRETQRQLREKNEVPVVALVGYTNAGKSSLMNYLIAHTGNGEMEKQVFEKDMLFATLDTYNRRIVLDDKKAFILTDTVGFVSKLPHSLVDAFKATLEEALNADLLLHVVDISNPYYEMQTKVTHEVLRELKADQKDFVTLYNKVDKCHELPMILTRDDYVSVSAKTGQNMDQVVEVIKTKLFGNMKHASFLIPYSEGKIASYLCDEYAVEKMDYLEEGTLIEADVKASDFTKYEKYRRDA